MHSSSARKHSGSRRRASGRRRRGGAEGGDNTRHSGASSSRSCCCFPPIFVFPPLCVLRCMRIPLFRHRSTRRRGRRKSVTEPNPHAHVSGREGKGKEGREVRDTEDTGTLRGVAVCSCLSCFRAQSSSNEPLRAGGGGRLLGDAQRGTKAHRPAASHRQPAADTADPLGRAQCPLCVPPPPSLSSVRFLPVREPRANWSRLSSLPAGPKGDRDRGGRPVTAQRQKKDRTKGTEGPQRTSREQRGQHDASEGTRRGSLPSALPPCLPRSPRALRCTACMRTHKHKGTFGTQKTRGYPATPLVWPVVCPGVV
jgi:hypothetical protein